MLPCSVGVGLWVGIVTGVSPANATAKGRNGEERVDRDDEDLVRLYLTHRSVCLLAKDDSPTCEEIETGKKRLSPLRPVGRPHTHKKRELPHRPQGRSRTPIRSVKPSSCRVDRKEVSASGLPLDPRQEGTRPHARRRKVRLA